MKEDGESKVLYKELSYAVVGCAQRVHAALGPGFPEAVYQKALALELVKARVPFQQQAPFQVYYDSVLCGEFRVDFCVDQKIILELKSAAALCPEHEAQLLAYLRASGLKLGLLMNFGEPRLKTKRLVL